MDGLGKSVLDRAVRKFRPRWVRAATDNYERFAPIATMELPSGKSLCVVAPHPDDESIGCGGLLALWASSGRRAGVVFLTAGEMGSPDLRRTTDAAARKDLMTELASRRRKEAEAALQILGADGTWLDGTDADLHRDEIRLADALAADWQRTPPDAIAAPYPADRHADHAVAARIVGSAARRVLSPSVPILAYEVWTPAPVNAVLDITSVADTKWHAIAAHASQTATTDYVGAAQGLNSFRAVSSGQKAGFAEAYHVTTGANYASKADRLRI